MSAVAASFRSACLGEIMFNTQSRFKATKSIAFVGLLAASSVVNALAIRSGFDGETAPRNDDRFVSGVTAGFDLNFFGTTYNSFFLNTNGNITFDGGLSTFTPFDLQATNQVIIAPFFADVDTRAGTPITYGTGSVDGRDAFGINWVDVGYFSSRDDLLNSFQLVLIDRSDTGAANFDFEFNFDNVEWETGSASSGTNGLGGSSARVGYSNGTNTNFELAGSAINGALLNNGPNALIANSLNSSELGRYRFTVRNGAVVTPPVMPPVMPPVTPPVTPPVGVPGPESLGLMLMGLGLLARTRARRK